MAVRHQVYVMHTRHMNKTVHQAKHPGPGACTLLFSTHTDCEALLMQPVAATSIHNMSQYMCPRCCRKEQRNLERQIRDNSRLEKVAQKQIREAAKRNDMASAKTLAKELVHTRRVTTRLWTNKAHMMSMNSQLTEQLGMVKVAGTLKQSTQVLYAQSSCLHMYNMIVKLGTEAGHLINSSFCIYPTQL